MLEAGVDDMWCICALLQVLPNQFQKGMVGPCPDNAAICNTLSCNESCTVGGTCVQGKCHCNLQYTGEEGQGSASSANGLKGLLCWLPIGPYQQYARVVAAAARY